MINICYCADNKLFKQLLISVVSLVDKTDETLNIINLTLELPSFIKGSKKNSPEQDRVLDNYVKQKNPNSRFKSIDVSNMFEKELLKGPNIHNRFYCYFICTRLLMDKIPELGDKAIYLDCDVIFHDDIKKLWEIDVENFDFAGRHDWLRSPNYLQSGVMIMNLEEMRKDKSMQRTRDYVTNKKIHAMLDMTALNRACKKKKRISSKLLPYFYKEKCIAHHICALTKFANIPLLRFLILTGLLHRIKPDEFDKMKKYQPQYTNLINKVEQILADNENI